MEGYGKRATPHGRGAEGDYMGKRTMIPAAGFALYWLTDILSFHATTAFTNLGGMTAAFENVYFVTLITARIVAYAVVSLVRSRTHCDGLPPAPAAIASTAASLAGIALVAGAVLHLHATGAGAFSPELAGELLTAGSATLAAFVAGAALFGASQGVMSLVWASKLTLFSYRGSYLYLIATHAGATVLCAATLLLPPSWLLPVTVASLVAANICSVGMPRPVELPHAVREQAGDIAPLLWRGVLAVGVFAFVSGFVSSIARQGAADADPVSLQSFTLVVSCVVLAVMAVPALAFHQPLKLETSYRVALPLSALGFLVLPGLIESVPPALSGVLATTGYMITGIVLYCLVAEVAKIARVPSLPLFAGSICLTLVCLLGGTFAGLALAPRLAQTGTGIALVGLGCLYLVALAASWLVGRAGAPSPKRRSVEGRAKPSPAEAPVAPADEAAPDTRPPLALDDLAERFDLSEQERTVLALLVEGRTMSRIAQELYLSPSAVKYHAQKLYRRFDVHSRSELNDAVARLRHKDGESPAVDDRLASAYDLTDREREVLARLACGLTTAEMAADLAISENTVKTHVKRIYGKLGVHSKQDVIDLVLDDPRPAS